MIFGLYSNFRLICFYLIFLFCKVYLISNFTITDHVIIINPILITLGSTADLVFLELFTIEMSNAAMKLKL